MNTRTNTILQMPPGMRPDQIEQVGTELRAEPGIVDVRVSPTVGRVLLVDYNRFATDSGVILAKVRQQGHAARLIGL